MCYNFGSINIQRQRFAVSQCSLEQMLINGLLSCGVLKLMIVLSMSLPLPCHLPLELC